LLAAEQGDITAQNNLGHLYAQGRGVTQDSVRAYQWFSLAATAGNTAAASNRDALSMQMTLEQVAQAQKQAEQWRAAKALERSAKCQTSNSADCD
jgi:TPR repeat protein